MEYGMACATREEAEENYAEFAAKMPELTGHPVRIEPSPLEGWFWYVNTEAT